MTVIEKIEAAYQRLEKAKQIVADGKVKKLVSDGDGYAVESSDGSKTYYVNGDCGCEDFKRHANEKSWWCKHKLAVEIHKQGGIKNADAKAKRHRRDDRRDDGSGARRTRCAGNG